MNGRVPAAYAASRVVDACARIHVFELKAKSDE